MSDDDPGRRLPGLPPTPTRATVTRATAVAATGAVVFLVATWVLLTQVCGESGCPPGRARDLAEALGAVGFLLLLGGGAYALTAVAHLRGVARRGSEPRDR